MAIKEIEKEEQPKAAAASEAREPINYGWAAVGLIIVIGLGFLTRFLEKNVPGWFEWSWVKSIEFPVYAIIVGLIGGTIITALGIREKVAPAFQTEFFIKTGLVLLGASINVSVIVSAAGPAIIQALLLVTGVFFFTWWIASVFKVDHKLRALLATAVSICGVSAAIAAAGAVRAKREQIAYAATLVILFALPSIFVLPWLAGVLGLSPEVAGAWIGGNIDTTAAVSAAGAIVGEEALQVASVVKLTQNVLIGVVAVALTLYFALKVERKDATEARAGVGKALWERFPKFVLAFIVASIVGTLYLSNLGEGATDWVKSVVNPLRTYFLILAFVSIGLEFRVKNLRQEGWRPVAVFGAATVFNILLALGLASLLFANFEI